MPKKRICEGKCKKFRVLKPSGTGRYGSGQCHCQICDIWMDHNGCHLKDGSQATSDVDGWYCNCCNYKVRRKPRNLQYKTKLRAFNTQDNKPKFNANIDLSYFNKQRATMIKKLTEIIIEQNNNLKLIMIDYMLLDHGFGIQNIETEFSTSIEHLISLAHIHSPPNKISMIMEFERVRSILKRIPTKQDIKSHSKLKISQYEEEFESWEHLLERLGYDPWYRNTSNSKHFDIGMDDATKIHKQVNSDIKLSSENLDDIKTSIQSTLKNDFKMLELFDILDKNISKCDKDVLEQISKTISDD